MKLGEMVFDVYRVEDAVNIFGWHSMASHIGNMKFHDNRMQCSGRRPFKHIVNDPNISFSVRGGKVFHDAIQKNGPENKMISRIDDNNRRKTPITSEASSTFKQEIYTLETHTGILLTTEGKAHRQPFTPPSDAP